MIQLALMRWRMHAEEETAAEDRESFVARFGEFAELAIESPSWRIWVAEADAKLIGNIWLQLVPHVPRPTKEHPPVLGYLTNVYVEPPYRNAGLGSRMLHEMAAWSREHSVAEVIVWPSERSYDYYRREGFVESDSLELPLKDD